MFATAAIALLLTGAEPPPLSASITVPANAAVIAALIDSLGDRDRDVRQTAALAISNYGSEAVEPLRLALHRPTPEARTWAAYALGLIGAPASGSAGDLVGLLKDPDADVRRHAAQALGRLAASERRDNGPTFSPNNPPAPPPMFPGDPPKP